MPTFRSTLIALSVIATGLLTTLAIAQERPGYGPTVNLATAKKLAATAMAEAQKNNWKVAVAIVDNHGTLVYYEMMDDTQTASAVVAIDKARSAAIYRRPTRVFEKLANEGKAAVLALTGMSASSGGMPIMVAGKVIGGIGVSGVTADQDEQVAIAGLEAVK